MPLRQWDAAKVKAWLIVEMALPAVAMAVAGDDVGGATAFEISHDNLIRQPII